MSSHPVRWLFQRGILDADQVQAFDGFLNLVENSAACEFKSVQLGADLINAGRPRFTPPESAVNARQKMQRALRLLNRTEQLVLMAVVLGKGISQIEGQLNLKPRTAKHVLQNALSTLGAEWPFLDRRVKRERSDDCVFDTAHPPQEYLQ